MNEINIIRAKPGHETLMANYFAVNEQHLQPWSPRVPRNYHSVETWKQRLKERELEFKSDQSVHFIGTDEQQSHVIGSCSISNIVRGVMQACHMGYSIAERYQGQGYMKCIVQFAIKYAFEELRLHRIMANHMPANKRSEALLQNLGFECEGVAKSYILINGRWEDHVLNSLINPDQRR